MINIRMNTSNKQYLQNLSEDFKERLRQINNALYKSAFAQGTSPFPPSSVELPYPKWMGGQGPVVTLTPQENLGGVVGKGIIAGEFHPFRNHINFLQGMDINDKTITHELAHAQQNIAAQFKNRKNAQQWIDSLKDYIATGKPKNRVQQSVGQSHIPYHARKIEVDARGMDSAKEAQNFKWDWLKSQKAGLEPKPTNPVMQTLSKYFPNLAPKKPEMPSFNDWVDEFNRDQAFRRDLRVTQETGNWLKAQAEPTDLKHKVGDFNFDPEKNSGNIVSSGDTPEQRQQFHRDRRSYRNEMDPRNLKRAKGKIATGWQAGIESGAENLQDWLRKHYDTILAKRGESISVATPSVTTPTATPQPKPKTSTPAASAPKQATMEPKSSLRSGGIEVPETRMASKIPEISATPKEPVVREFAPRGPKGGVGGIKIPLIGGAVAGAFALANKAFGDTPMSWGDVANQTLQGGLESLNPLGVFDGGSLGTDDVPVEVKGSYNFEDLPKPPKPEPKELPGSEYMFPNKTEQPKPAPAPKPENTPEEVPSPKPGIRPASRGSEEQPSKTNTEPEKKDQEEDENPNSFKNQMKQVVFECLIKATK